MQNKKATKLQVPIEKASPEFVFISLCDCPSHSGVKIRPVLSGSAALDMTTIISDIPTGVDPATLTTFPLCQQIEQTSGILGDGEGETNARGIVPLDLVVCLT
ncbi:MAG: hypothetical protein AAGN66_30090, partial [Acidobacteriota bacterium]